MPRGANFIIMKIILEQTKQIANTLLEIRVISTRGYYLATVAENVNGKRKYTITAKNDTICSAIQDAVDWVEDGVAASENMRNFSKHVIEISS